MGAALAVRHQWSADARPRVLNSSNPDEVVNVLVTAPVLVFIFVFVLLVIVVLIVSVFVAIVVIVASFRHPLPVYWRARPS